MNMATKKTGRTPLFEAIINNDSASIDELLQKGADVNKIDSMGRTPLIRALESKFCNINTILKLVDAGADVNHEDSIGKTVLMYLLESGFDTVYSLGTMESSLGECVSTFVKKGANVNYQDKEGNTPLILVAQKYFYSSTCVQALLQVGADVNIFNNKGETALIRAAKEGSWMCVDALIKAGAGVNMRQHNNGKSPGRYTALEHAAKAGSEMCVKSLIKSGASVRSLPKESSALMLAVASGNNSCVVQLIRAGAEVGEEAEDWMTPLMLASMEGYDECVDTLVKELQFTRHMIKQDVKGMTALMYAARRGHLPCVERLVSYEVKANNNGHTALMLAARGGYHQCVKLLTDKTRLRPNVNQQDNSWETALMHAARFNTYRLSFSSRAVDGGQCISLLLAAGADVNTENCAGQTALMLAAQNGQNKGVHLLLGKANVNQQNKYGDTSLMFASRGNHVQSLKYLIQAGADVNMNNHQGETALISAGSNGNMECVNQLIKSGANVNFADGLGFTSLKLASKNGYDQCVNLLIKAGADVNNDDNDVTPLMLAAGSDQAACVKLLMKEGADVNFEGKEGDTILSYALKANSNDCMKMLIEAGADSSGHTLICKIIKENCHLKEKQIKNLLYAGACLNTGLQNALITCLQQDEDEELALLLFAAGEELVADEIEDVPDVLKPPEQMSLMHLCRDMIRTHLLEISNVNLLVRVPKLGVPSQLVEYLLYGVEAESIKNV